ncbi:hypothetical protein L1987_53077 [Smallanthus sonchifolius]|uniref:Uncharacterized protein n=2 Tax=Smallanthus sonchifolius TaxID=185202 RepID=A0ACB9EVB0_9ASTR|nr:hypothetical protein L1987_53075 [Smallanthus sonchifolius]KAI3762638.1 hypothetical protein L1987_53077 [Smallanthus sonchifolius]
MITKLFLDFPLFPTSSSPASISALSFVYVEALQYHHRKSSPSTIAAAGSNLPLVANHRCKLHRVRFLDFWFPKEASLGLIRGSRWQDVDNIRLLSDLLMQNSAQRPKVLTVEDKLVLIGRWI